MPAWARHRVGEREPKNGVRHVWCVVSAKEAWHNSDIDCVPGVYDYMFSLCCTDDGNSRNYSFDVHCIDERCDTSVMLIKLNNGDVLEFKPSEFLRRGDSYTSWNDVGDARDHDITVYDLTYRVDDQALKRMLDVGVAKMRIAGTDITRFSEYVFQREEFTSPLREAYDGINKTLDSPYQPRKTIYDDF
jgi:hypothetical protein